MGHLYMKTSSCSAGRRRSDAVWFSAIAERPPSRLAVAQELIKYWVPGIVANDCPFSMHPRFLINPKNEPVQILSQFASQHALHSFQSSSGSVSSSQISDALGLAGWKNVWFWRWQALMRIGS